MFSSSPWRPQSAGHAGSVPERNLAEGATMANALFTERFHLRPEGALTVTGSLGRELRATLSASDG